MILLPTAYAKASAILRTFSRSKIRLISGVTLVKQFDYEKLKFEHPGLAVVYTIGFLIVGYILISKPKNN
jgi:hypothetical protein